MKNFFENYEICKKCGGECCKRCGCNYYPKDFKEMTFEHLKSILDKGEISITTCVYVNADCNNKIFIEKVLNLRARNINRPIVDLISKKNTCSVLTETGCKYSFNERPTGGILLIPDNDECINIYPPELQLEEWKKHQEVLKILVKHYTNNPFEKEFELQVAKVSEALKVEARLHLSRKTKLTIESIEIMQTLKLLQDFDN
jgi:hypothetical protein